MGEQLDIFGARDVDRTSIQHCTDCGKRGHNTRKCPDSIDARFAAFHQANPHVLDEMLRLARARVDAGATRIGVKALWEELRTALTRIDDGEGAAPEYRLNNSHTALYARKLIEIEPSLSGVIELRTRKARSK